MAITHASRQARFTERLRRLFFLCSIHGFFEWRLVEQ
jgi:hypothetical protein